MSFRGKRDKYEDVNLSFEGQTKDK